jgi:mRNA interferase MazF
MVTSNLMRAGHPSRVVLRLSTDAGKMSGLRGDSVVMADNVATVLESHINRVIGALLDMTLIDAALRHTLGL